ncbi:tetratricopeptide repeat protein [Dactylosporangium sp. NPDC051541]|uniref:tetratricopeptide repeat protein n=1 Tax=Dactylosporangium sp. NPDC051541 TaxID=3363977 RepID=UPI0037B129A3
MALDRSLGRVLSSDRVPVATCFQVSPGVVVTAGHVLAEAGRTVLVDALAGDEGAVPARVLRVDAVHDLAVLEVAQGVLTGVVAGFAPTAEQAMSTPVTVAGVADAAGFVEASGRLEGSATRDGVVVGRVESPAVTAGMRGAPVRRRSDGLVVAVVSGRHNSADGWLRDSVWVIRVEELLAVLDGLADVWVGRSSVGAAVDVSVVVDAESVTVSGHGRQAVTVPHQGVVPGLRVSLDAFRRSRSGLAAHRDLSADGGPDGPSQAPVLAVGRALTRNFLADGAGRLLQDLVESARAGHRPTRVGLRVVPGLAGLPWETMLSPGSGRPLGIDPQVRAFRQARSAPAARPGPLRIVVAIASPLTGGGQVLDYEQELRNVLAAVRSARAFDADVRVVHFATTAAIRAALSAAPAHVLHLSGHGTPGFLVLEDEDGAARPVTADQFLDEAIPAGAIPPVFALAACYTVSLAEGLLARGAGVVIATETSISDVYATRVFARVYARLAADPAADVVAAVADARADVQLELERSVDERDRRLARFQEWSTVSVYAPAGSVPVVDVDAPPAPIPAARSGAGVLRREAGEVVGRRREQREWPAALLSGRTAGIVVHGLGGVGKTTLADELVTRVLEREPDRVVVAVTGPVTGEQLLTELALQTGDQLEDRETAPSHRVARLLSRVADAARTLPDRTAALHELLTEVPVLLVLDNFEDNLPGTGVQPVAPPLARLLTAVVTRPGRGRLLITCRYRFTLPGNAHRALTFHHLGPLSFAETMKLAWALPHLDRMTGADLERVWRAVGGHPRCLEYVDALLAGGTARHTDVTLRLATAVERHLRTSTATAAVTDADIDAYLGANAVLDDALAEVATLAADDILLERLLTGLEPNPDAVRLITGASVYRVPVDGTALSYVLGDLVTDDPDFDRAVSACVDSGLLTPGRGPDGSPSYFVHRWTATALAGRDGNTAALTDAHLRAAAYWVRRADTEPQPLAADADDLREAHHHRSAAHALDPRTDLHDIARLCHRLQRLLARLGRRHEAAEYSEAGLRLHRQLYPADPAPDDTDQLAGALDDHGIRLLGLGRRAAALAATAEAVDLRRHLAAADPAAFEPGLAGSLRNLGGMLSELDREDEALIATAEAVELHRRLAAADPAAFERELAGSLSNLGNRLSKLGWPDEAVAAAVESIGIQRRLAAADLAPLETDLAGSLSNLGAMLSKLGRWEEALTAAAEAVDVHRRAARADPAAFAPSLATSLNNLGNRLAALRRLEEAVAATAEAVEIRRRLAATNPAAFEPLLARSLHNLALYLRDISPEEAEAAAEEARQVAARGE